MDSPCQFLNKYLNLLKPCSEIETAFMRELQAQQQVLDLVRHFGTFRMLTLTSIIGAIRHTIPEEEKVTLFGKTTVQDRSQ